MNRLLRWLGIAYILTFAVPVVLVAYGLMRQPQVAKQSVLHVTLDGPLPEVARPALANFVSQRMHHSLRQITQSIRMAAADDRIVGLVLDIRTAGLGLAQISELRDAVAVFAASHKYNAAYLQSAGESGRGDGVYALATAAKQVILSPAGEINLTGLRSEVPFLKDAFARLKIRPYTEQRYEFKNYANTFTQANFTPAHLAALKGVVDDLQQTLIDMIAEGRQVTHAQARSFVQDAPWSSEDALTHKLVDKVAYWDEVRDEIEKLAKRDEALVDLDTYVTRTTPAKGGVNVAFIVGAGQIDVGDNGKNPLEAKDSMGSDTMVQAFREARDDGAKAIVLRVDSPGGSYLASDLVRREVELTRQAGIPMVVSMGDVAASGGYLVATDADHIVVEPGTITGSIGVLAASFALRETLEHFTGVHVGTYESLPHPGTLNILDPPTDEDRSRIGRSIDRIYRAFVTRVAQTRHKTYDEIHALAKGRIWSGNQAVQNGLADELGGIETALAYVRKRLNLAAGVPLRLTTYPQPDSPLDILRDYLSMNVSMLAPALVHAAYTQLQAAIFSPPNLDSHAVMAPLPHGNWLPSTPN